MDYRITNEEQAFNLLDLIKTNRIELNKEVTIIFDKWPAYYVKLEGEDFRGSVPTRVLPPLLDFQRTIYTLYADIYYKGNTKRLTKEDRDKLELVLTIREGSSIFQAFLDKSFTEIANSAITGAIEKMESPDILIAILGTALVIGANVGFKAYLKHRASSHKHEISEQTKLELSKEETKRYEILSQATHGNPYLTDTKINAIHDSQAKMLQILKPEDKAYFTSETIVEGSDAKPLSKPIETEDLGPRDVRLDGIYRILAVNARLKEGFDLTLYNIETKKKFHAGVEQANLTADGATLLKNATFDKKEIELQINAQVIEEQIKDAKIMKL